MLLGFVIGFVTAAIIFIIFYKNNLNHLARARNALVMTYEKAEDQVGDLIRGIDKKVDAQINKRKEQ